MFVDLSKNDEKDETESVLSSNAESAAVESRGLITDSMMEEETKLHQLTMYEEDRMRATTHDVCTQNLYRLNMQQCV